MDALDVLKVCLRRWYVCMPIVLLAVIAGLGLSQHRPTEYSGTASFAIIYDVPKSAWPSGSSPLESNPLSGNGGTLLNEALIADLNSPESQRTLGDPSTSGTSSTEPSTGSRFAVWIPQDSQSLTINVYGTNEGAVTSTVNKVLTAAGLRAQVVQARAGVPKDAQYTTFVTMPAQVTSLPPTSTKKLLAAVTGVGVLAAAALSLLVERLLTRRRATRPGGVRHGRGGRGRGGHVRRTSSSPGGSNEILAAPQGPAATAGRDTIRNFGAKPQEKEPVAAAYRRNAEMSSTGHPVSKS